MQLLDFTHPTESFHVRRVEHNNEDWFVARDICESLGIEQTGPALAKLDPDEVNQIHLIDTLKRTQKTYIVSESGLYALVLRSDKPAARAFRKWVTSEVLPALRRNGVYSLAGKLPLESLQVKRLELKLRAAKLREEAAYLELTGQLSCNLPGGVRVTEWISKHKHVQGRKRSNLVRAVKRFADHQRLPMGFQKVPSDGGLHITMLPKDIEDFFAQREQISTR